jgi:hypothetical protein
MFEARLVPLEARDFISGRSSERVGGFGHFLGEDSAHAGAPHGAADAGRGGSASACL